MADAREFRRAVGDWLARAQEAVVDLETGEIRENGNGSQPRQLAHEAFEAVERAPHVFEVTETVVRKCLVPALDMRQAVQRFELQLRAMQEQGVPEPIAKRTVAVKDTGIVAER